MSSAFRRPEFRGLCKAGSIRSSSNSSVGVMPIKRLPGVRAGAVCLLATVVPPSPPLVSMAEAPAAAGWTLKPYNNGAKELNLWPLESRKLVQSPVVIAPDRHVMAYTEVTFMPHNRQTFAVLYAVRNPQAMLAPVVDEPIAYVALPFRPSFWQRVRFWGAAGTATSVPPPMNPYLPEHHTQRRQRLFAAGDSVSSANRFETLTIVDWSNSGKRCYSNAAVACCMMACIPRIFWYMTRLPRPRPCTMIFRLRFVIFGMHGARCRRWIRSHGM